MCKDVSHSLLYSISQWIKSQHLQNNASKYIHSHLFILKYGTMESHFTTDQVSHQSLKWIPKLL